MLGNNISHIISEHSVHTAIFTKRLVSEDLALTLKQWGAVNRVMRDVYEVIVEPVFERTDPLLIAHKIRE